MRIAFLNSQVYVQELLGTNDVMLFFTVRDYDDAGRLDYMLLHEMCHIICTAIRDKTQEESRRDEEVEKVQGISTELLSGKRVKSGFDSLSNFEVNPHNKRYRKYERLNDAITDLFAIEAMNRLHNRGVYLLVDPFIAIEDVKYANTSLKIKELVAPLIKKYRNELNQAITGDSITPLTDAIGTDNFEELNDCVNIVDAIISGDLHRSYSIEEKDEAIRQQEDRCRRIYESMKRHRKIENSNER